ncbi:hypothetical protein GCM10028803_47080 [Larkinella knui]|uniref:DUF1574 domain-containing protein n=1 Tax=Larkinella knui TaxID=2025310 RepID=A0A3P1CPV7_9BACT|nr:hypothetical protein [Larkinella knui]RRB15295.1 hypothetical protein EHT87_12210 [Larkinella knui]
MLKLVLKLLALTTVLLGVKMAIWAYLHTYQTRRFDESGYKLDSMLKPIRQEINTVFVGSSRTAHSVNPAVFDSATQHQTRSFNHGISAMFAPNTFAECEKLLKMDGLHLKTIFLELSFPPLKAHEDPFGRGNLFHEFSFKNSYFRREQNFGRERVQRGITLYDSFLTHFIMLRSAILMLVATVVRNDRDNFVMTPTGYRYFHPSAFLNRHYNRVSAQTPPDTTTLRVPFTERDRFYVNRLMQLAQRCEAKNVAIYFYLPNRMMDEEKQTLPNIYAALPERYRISMPYRRQFTPPFPADCSDDKQHLNQTAATLYTQLFAQAFLQKQPVTATR